MTRIYTDFIAALYQKCENKGKCCLHYELGPTGEIHLGIARSLILMKRLTQDLNEQGIVVNAFIRVNDLLAIWKGKPFGDESLHGRQLKDILLSPSTSFVDKFRKDLSALVEGIGLSDSRIINSSEYYLKANFQKKVWSAVEYARVNGRDLSKLIYPRPPRNGRLYSTVISYDAGQYRYFCSETGEEAAISPSVDGGTISFAYENPCFWSELEVDCDIHASNHNEIFKLSQQIYEKLFARPAPMAVPLGIVRGVDGKMVSKSKRNFTPHTEWATSLQLNRVVERLNDIRFERDVGEADLLTS